jgi:hypothetical protein
MFVYNKNYNFSILFRNLLIKNENFYHRDNFIYLRLKLKYRFQVSTYFIVKYLFIYNFLLSFQYININLNRLN